MQSRSIIMAIALVLAVPTALAAWGAEGSFEPSTSYDRTGVFMWPNPDTDPAGPRKIYFNGFHGSGGQFPAAVNPNSAALGSAILLPVNLHTQALLGVWRDCNKDGYVGWGDGAMLEYRAVLLTLPNMHGETVGNTVCPVEPLGPPKAPFPNGDHSGYRMHNDGEWVRELIPIGPESSVPTNTDIYPWNIPDAEARVWADWGEPGGRPGYICYLTAHPLGTFRTVGGMVNLVDCYGRNRVTGTINALPGGSAAYNSVKGSNCDQSHLGSPTAYRLGCNPWGTSPDRAECSTQPQACDDAFVDVGDCQNPLVPSRSVANVPVMVPRPNPTANSARPSPAGTMYHLENDFQDCKDKTWGKTDHAPYQTERDLLNQQGPRMLNDWVFAFREANRPGVTANPAVPQLGRSTANDYGLGIFTEGMWSGHATSTYGHNPIFNIDDANLKKVTYITYYAFVGPSTTSLYTLPSASVGTYGDTACNNRIGPGFGVENPTANWYCDPADWWPQQAQADRAYSANINGFQTFIGQYVGAPYQLMDVDCYDLATSDLRNEGVHWGLATGTQCN